MGGVKVRRLRCIAGRYFWRPTPAIRRLGFANEALGSDLAKAVGRAEQLNAEVDRALKGEDVAAAVVPYSMDHLVQVYRADEAFTDLKPKTQAVYGRMLDEIVRHDGDVAVEAITRRYLKDVYRTLKPRGLATAAAFMRMFRIILRFAVDEGWIDENPARQIKIKSPHPRRQVWEESEIVAFCAAANDLLIPSMGLAVQLAYHLGQREGDVLRLPWRLWDGTAFLMEQGKTGVRVIVPATSELRALLSGMIKASTQVVVSEATRRPYREDHFRHLFAEVRRKAGIRADLQYRDLRRTAVVRLARAGCTVPEIASITGHSLRTVHQIMETYLPPDSTVARNAVTKLDWLARNQNQVAKAADEDEG
jgi:integrase